MSKELENEKDPVEELEEIKESYKKSLLDGYPDFLAEIKGYQKEHAPTYKPRSSINSQWQAEWKDFIKYDMDWDWGFLTDLILYKLQKMRAWFSRFGMTEDAAREKITAEIDEAIRLYNYAMDTDFDKEVMEWSEKHSYRWVEIREYDGHIMHSGKVLYKTSKVREDKEPSYHFLENKEADEWCKANGHKAYKDVIYSYCSKWDYKINYYIWKYKMHKAWKREQKAFDTFFLYISKHFREWWD